MIDGEKRLNIVYPGRFQPMTTGHTANLTMVHEKQPVGRLVVAIPNNKNRSFSNPFLGDEAMEIANRNIDFFGIKAETQLVELGSERLSTVWANYLRDNRIDLVATGNVNMARLVNILSIALGVKTRAFLFKDGGQSCLRASDVRSMIKNGDRLWRDCVSPSAASYIDSLGIEWNGLPQNRKRNWNYA